LQAALDQLANLIDLLPGIDRADVGILVEWIAQAQGGDAIAQFANGRGENSLLHQ
jgi:hypothetical protein